jgi:hypothetical protein
MPLAITYETQQYLISSNRPPACYPTGAAVKIAG